MKKKINQKKKTNNNKANNENSSSENDNTELKSENNIQIINGIEKKIKVCKIVKEYDLLLKDYFKLNKSFMNKQCTFIKQTERLYNNNVNFKLDKYHITNLYPTFKKELFQTTLDENIKYNANVEGIGLLC